MGSSQSTRKLSVDNENSIQVSQDALNRIQAQLSAQPAPPKSQYEAPPNYYESYRPQQDYASEEAYWARRIEGLKRVHERMNSNMQAEYQKAMKDAEHLYDMANDEKVSGGLPPCQEEKAKVLQCYSDNPNKTLLCSVVVREFNDCVCKSRLAAITAS